MTLPFAAAFLFSIIVGLLALAAILHALSRLGRLGQRCAEQSCAAPLLDVVVFLFTGMPPFLRITISITMGYPATPRPRPSLALVLHQVVQGTFTAQRTNVLGTPKESPLTEVRGRGSRFTSVMPNCITIGHLLA